MSLLDTLRDTCRTVSDSGPKASEGALIYGVTAASMLFIPSCINYDYRNIDSLGPEGRLRLDSLRRTGNAVCEDRRTVEELYNNAQGTKLERFIEDCEVKKQAPVPNYDDNRGRNSEYPLFRPPVMPDN